MVELFCKAQVNQLREAIGVDHDVLGLEVPEDDVLGMQVADGVEHPGHIKHSGIVIKAAIAGESREEFSPLDVLEHHVDVFGVLKGRLPQ